MKRIFIVGLTVISFSLCRLVNAQTNDNSGKNTASIFNQTLDKVSNFFGSSSEEFIGTWNYKGTACKFETENLLKKIRWSRCCHTSRKTIQRVLQQTWY